MIHSNREKRSRQVFFDIFSGIFIFIATLIIDDSDCRMPVVIVVRVLPSSINEEIFLFMNELQEVAVADLIIGRHLDRHRRACLGAKPAEDAAREVDSEPFGISSSSLSLSRHERDAIDRADCRAEEARNAPLLSVRIARENYSGPIARMRGPLLLGILDRHRFREEMPSGDHHPLQKCSHTFDE